MIMENVFILIVCDEKLKLSYEVNWICEAVLIIFWFWPKTRIQLFGRFVSVIRVTKCIIMVVSESMPSFRATSFTQITVYKLKRIEP